MTNLGCIHPTAADAATKTNGRQDEQDLQDGFCSRLADAMRSFQLNPISSYILSIRSILSKNQGNELMFVIAKEACRLWQSTEIFQMDRHVASLLAMTNKKGFIALITEPLGAR